MSIWWVLPAVVLIGGALVTLRWTGEVLVDAQSLTKSTPARPLDELGERARVATERLGDISAVAANPVVLLHAKRRRPWRELRLRWRAARRSDATPS